MLRSVSNQLFFFPALFLAVLLGFFAFTEYRMILNDRVIRNVIESPGSDITYDITNAIKNFRQRLDNFSNSNTVNLEEYEKLRELLGSIRLSTNELRNYFHKDKIEIEEHYAETDLLKTIEKMLEQIILPELLPADFTFMNDINGNAHELADMVFEINHTMNIAHKAEIGERLEQLDYLKNQRILLLFLVVLCGLVLFGLIYRNASNYKRNSEIIKSAFRYNALFAAALQSTRVGVLIRDLQKPNQPVVFVNNAFAGITGYSSEDVINNKSDFLFGWHTDPVMIARFKEAILQKQPATFDLLTYRKSGAPFWSEWHISPVIDKDDKGNEILTHYVSLLTDITGIRQTQEALMLAKEQAEHANAVKSNFLAVMSHEIRTPINGLLGVLDLIKGTSLDSEQRKFVDIAATSSRALHEIINDILDFSKMEAGKIEIISEPFLLGSLLKDVINLTKPVADNRKLELKLSINELVPERLNSDAGRIRQIFLNLVTNAIKFTDSGYVEIRVIHLLNEERDGNQIALLRFEVVDTGIGISTVDQDKLFKEFSQIERSFTRRFGGTGLGLAITKKLVKLLGGEIGIESQPSKGSKFWFILPLVVDNSKVLEVVDEPMGEKTQSPVSRADKLILLVEDNETNILVASKYLQKAGYNFDTAINGMEALSKTKSKAYDLILMDVSMPEMDGLEATQHIRSIGEWASLVPIIAMTAHVMPGDRERCLVAGMNDYLNKPLNYGVFIKTLDKWLHAEGEPVKRAVYVGNLSSNKLEIDPNTLKQLSDDLGNETVLRITQVFLVDLASRINGLRVDGSIANLEEIKLISHTLKSSSLSCGLVLFSDLMKEIEEASTKGNRESLQILLEKVPEAYTSARQALVVERDKFRS